MKNNKIVLEGNNELEAISISILDENAKVVVDNNEITNAGGWHLCHHLEVRQWIQWLCYY